MTHERFREHYSTLSDEDLLQIAGGGEDYRPEAVDAAKSELSTRGIKVTQDLIDSAVVGRKRAREQLELELVASSGFFGALALTLAGRPREAGNALRAEIRHRLMVLLILAVVMIIVVLLTLLIEHQG